MMVVLFLFGSSLVYGLLLPLGSAEWAVAIAIIIIERPPAGLIGMIGFRAAAQEKLMLTFFGLLVSDLFTNGLWGQRRPVCRLPPAANPWGWLAPCHPAGQTIDEYRVLKKAALRSIACERQQSPKAGRSGARNGPMNEGQVSRSQI